MIPLNLILHVMQYKSQDFSFFPLCVYPVVPVAFIEKSFLIVLQWCISYRSFYSICVELLMDFKILFHQSICLFLWQYHIILLTMVFIMYLDIRQYKASNFVPYHNRLSCSQPVHFHANFAFFWTRISLSISMNIQSFFLIYIYILYCHFIENKGIYLFLHLQDSVCVLHVNVLNVCSLNEQRKYLL